MPKQERGPYSFINDNSNLISQRKIRAEVSVNCCHTGGPGAFVSLSLALCVMPVIRAECPPSLGGCWVS